MFKSLNYFYFIILLLVFGCKNDKNNYDYETETNYYYSEEYGFNNGRYCARVTYYNPNTGTNSTYTLEVEVEDNEVTVIYWSNGGWLDEDHFTAETLDENGYCSFTSDKGYDFTVQILSEDCDYTDTYDLQNDILEDEETSTCPQCGGDKEEYETYCYYCSYE
ncbi:MAG: hypothetical protein ACK4UK_05470 [Flavobacterium sp.]